MTWGSGLCAGVCSTPPGRFTRTATLHTVYSVTLDRKVSPKDVFIREVVPGVDFLDEGAAIAAFQRAQPFPTPLPIAAGEPWPQRDLCFSFGFYLEVSSRPAVRILRSGATRNARRRAR